MAWLRRRGMSYPGAKALLEGKCRGLTVKKIDELCLLLQCTPNDLFCWQPDKEALPPGHPLQQLQPSNGQLSILEQLRILNTPQLQELRKLLDALQKRKENS